MTRTKDDRNPSTNKNKYRNHFHMFLITGTIQYNTIIQEAGSLIQSLVVLLTPLDLFFKTDKG
jgi:hypothetical protein